MFRHFSVIGKWSAPPEKPNKGDFCPARAVQFEAKPVREQSGATTGRFSVGGRIRDPAAWNN